MAFIHRFGSALHAHFRLHCVVVDGVFDITATGGVVFHAATGLEANAIGDVQACVRRRLLRYCARPPFAPDRLRELDSERLLHEVTKPGPGGTRPLRLTHRSCSDRLAALVPLPRVHRNRYFGASCERPLTGSFGGGRDRLLMAVGKLSITAVDHPSSLRL